jgi:hypothetical protein
MGIKLPPMNRNVWRLETMLANNILHMQVLMTDIYPEHFAPKGVLAHVHIPTYVYIPKAVFKEYGISINENTTSYVTFWQRLQEAQWQSTELIEAEHLRSTFKTSYRKLLRNQAPKTVATGKEGDNATPLCSNGSKTNRMAQTIRRGHLRLVHQTNRNGTSQSTCH